MLLVGLLLLTTSIFFPPYHSAFVGDDYVQLGYVYPFVERPLHVYRVFDPYWLPWYYRPLQNVWFLANRLIFGLEPFGYYALQLLVHLLAVALVYRVARQFRLSRFAAVGSAALFAIHAHHVDVVAWISSIAIVLAAVFSLASLSAYLSYRQRPTKQVSTELVSSKPASPHRSLLLLTLVFFLLTLSTHEESFLLPPFLLLMRLASGDWRRSGFNLRSLLSSLKKAWPETAVFLIMFLALAVYLYWQFTRPNLTIDLGETPSSHWLVYLSPLPISQFVVATVDRYTRLTLFLPFLETQTYLVTYLVAIGMGVWFWRGGRVVRLGLLWTLLHLAFIYWALWSQKPNLYAGRHIYNASIGLVLAIGAAMDALIRRYGARTRPLRWPVRTVIKPVKVAIAMVITAVLLAHIYVVGLTQAVWLADTNEEKAAEQQMKQLLPAVSEQTHVFAYRFPITPSFLPAVTEIWYDQPIAALGGSFGLLEQHGRADPSFYVFDYDPEQKRLYNLMPELQAYDETIFLWSQTPRAEILSGTVPISETNPLPYRDIAIAGPPPDWRAAIPVQPPADGQWLSLVYVTTIPDHSVLQFALHKDFGNLPGEDGLVFRVRAQRPSGETDTLFETFITADEPGGEGSWLDVTIPLAAYWNEAVILRLETAAGADRQHDNGYWANPRIVIDQNEES